MRAVVPAAFGPAKAGKGPSGVRRKTLGSRLRGNDGGLAQYAGAPDFTSRADAVVASTESAMQPQITGA